MYKLRNVTGAIFLVDSMYRVWNRCIAYTYPYCKKHFSINHLHSQLNSDRNLLYLYSFFVLSWGEIQIYTKQTWNRRKAAIMSYFYVVGYRQNGLVYKILTKAGWTYERDNSNQNKHTITVSAIWSRCFFFSILFWYKIACCFSVFNERNITYIWKIIDEQ